MDLEAADDDDASRTDNSKEEEDGLPDILTLAEGHPGREFASMKRRPLSVIPNLEQTASSHQPRPTVW